MKGNVCILCLRRFEGITGEIWNENTETCYQSRVLVPYSGLGQLPPPLSVDTSEDCTRQKQKGHLNLYSKFLLFTDRYLKISLSETFKQREEERKITQAFCENCRGLVSHVCDLYAELEAVKLHLLNKVVELENVTRLSTKTVSSKLSRGLFKCAAEELNIKMTQLMLYRKMLILNCKRKTSGGTPKVLVPRGLFPEYWKFTYSATLKVFMNLIVVFALAADNVTPTPLKDEPKRVNNTHKVQHKRRPRAKRKNGDTCSTSELRNSKVTMKIKFGEDKPVKQEGGYEQDENNSFNDVAADKDFDDGDFLCTGVDDDNENGSDWSRGAVSPTSNRDSACSDVNFTIGQEDAAPKKRRRLRRNCQRYSFKQEPENGEENEEKDVDFKCEAGNKRRRTSKRSSGSVLKKEANISCKICKKKFINRTGLSAHMHFIHNTRFDYPCNICGLKCKSKEESLRHNRIVHDHERSVPCTTCGQKFMNNRALAAHMHFIHQLSMENSCNICGEKFKTLLLRQKHKIKCKLRLLCLVCSKTLIGERRFRGHLRRHEEDATLFRIFHCESCPKTFCTEELLAEHEMSAHEKEFTCSICDDKFSNYKTLRNHLKTHETDEKKFWCNFCYHRYTNEQYLQVHQKIIHVGQDKLVCDHERCSVEFNNVDNLNEHLKVHIEEMRSSQFKTESKHNDDDKNNVANLINDEIPVFTCKTCGWGFLNKYSLTLHELVHSYVSYDKESSFRCPEPNCFERVYYQTHPLLFHYNSCHGTKSQPYHCHECEAKFTNLVMFKVHLRCHEERKSGKRFTCDVCNEECLDTLSFNWHRRSHYLQRSDQEVTEEEDDNNGRDTIPKTKETQRRSRGKRLPRNGKVQMNSLREKRKRTKLMSYQSSKPLTKEQQESKIAKEERKVNCDLCQKTCESSLYLWRHLENEHADAETGTEAEKSVQCNFCSCKFIREQTHQVHVKCFHQQNNKFICDAEWCNGAFENHLALNEHLEKVHLGSEGEENTTASKYAMEPSSTNEARQLSCNGSYKKIVHKVKSLRYCKICNWGFVNPDFLQLHEICHIPKSSQTQTYDCPICEMKFTSNLVRTKHFNVEHGNNLKLFKCKKCPSKVFRSAKSLSSHMDYHRLKQKNSDKVFICEHCGKTFSDPYVCNTHRRTHDMNNLRACPEEGCEQKFTTEKTLERHLKVAHGQGDRYPCAVCGMSFPYPAMTKKHTNDVHGDRKFECDICHKMFKRMQHLQDHLQNVHENIPGFICTDCGKAYKNKVGLNWHIASVHTPDHLKKFGCPYCPYRTHRKILFNSHLKTCTKNKGIPHVPDRFSASLQLQPPRKRRGGPRKKKKVDSEEKEMGEKTTTEEEDDGDEKSIGTQEIPSIPKRSSQQRRQTVPDRTGFLHYQQQQQSNQGQNVLPLHPQLFGSIDPGSDYLNWINSSSVSQESSTNFDDQK